MRYPIWWHNFSRGLAHFQLVVDEDLVTVQSAHRFDDGWFKSNNYREHTRRPPQNPFFSFHLSMDSAQDAAMAIQVASDS